MLRAVLFGCLLAAADAAKLPDKFPKCRRSDPALDECLRDAIQAALPTLTKGVASLGMPGVDPLRISSLHIRQGDGPVAVDLKFVDLDFANMGSARVVKVAARPSEYKMELVFDLQRPLFLDGDYEINGKILVLPIAGKGKCHIELENLHAVLALTGEETQKGNKTYMNLSDLNLKFDTTRLRMNFENLFNSDKALGDNMNLFLNENWKEILREIRPAFEEALGTAFREISRRIFDKVPYDDIFLK